MYSILEQIDDIEYLKAHRKTAMYLCLRAVTYFKNNQSIWKANVYLLLSKAYVAFETVSQINILHWSKLHDTNLDNPCMLEQLYNLLLEHESISSLYCAEWDKFCRMLKTNVIDISHPFCDVLITLMHLYF